MATDPAIAKALFLEALTKEDAAARRAFLESATGTDDELCARVQALLAAHDRALTAVDTLAEAVPAPVVGADVWADGTEPAGTVLAGKYILLEMLGEGGMGSVWRAKQLSPMKRTVAVKLLKPGADAEARLARFEAERQILGQLHHPHIATIHDSGVHHAHPYFVMELVPGTPLTEFCEAQSLPLATRLKLFLQAAQAIQHAHHRGIIHCDLKPSNILAMTTETGPTVKVIDFGVAQRTTTIPKENDARGFAGSPLYISPEQAALAGVIDPRSDVYSLGVVLYELVSGQLPFEKALWGAQGPVEFLRQVREEMPPPPSGKFRQLPKAKQVAIAARRGLRRRTLRRHFRTDLDALVLKALAKDPAARYATVTDLMADVERFLAGETIAARRPTWRYRIGKYTRRHRASLVAASVMGLMIVALGAFAGLQYRENQRLFAMARLNAQEANHAENLKVELYISRHLHQQAEATNQLLWKDKSNLFEQLYDVKTVRDFYYENFVIAATLPENAKLTQRELLDRAAEKLVDLYAERKDYSPSADRLQYNNQQRPRVVMEITQYICDGYTRLKEYDRTRQLQLRVLRMAWLTDGEVAHPTLGSWNNLIRNYEASGKIPVGMIPLEPISLNLHWSYAEKGSPRDIQAYFVPLVRKLLADGHSAAAEEFCQAMLPLAWRKKLRWKESCSIALLFAEALLTQQKYPEAEVHLLSCSELFTGFSFGDPLTMQKFHSELFDKLIQLYTLTNRPEPLKKYRSLRAQYPREELPPPRPHEYRLTPPMMVR
ncbi:MAG: serine/threonine-protein kinase [Gemmataceae bacterium]